MTPPRRVLVQLLNDTLVAAVGRIRTRMKKNLARIIIVLLVAAEIAWFISPSHKSLMGDAYRNQERIAALNQNASQPSLANQAIVDNEMKLLSEHAAIRHFEIFAVFLGLDGILIFLFWNPKASKVNCEGVRP